MEKHTLYELLEYTKRVVALNFPETIWVSCEISQIKDSRGNLYLDLIEKDEQTGEMKAQINAAIWYKNHLFIKRKLGELAPSILEAGRKVLLRVRVDFNEVYGLKLLVEDVDPSFTIGVMEMERQKTVEKLKKELLLDKNGDSFLPMVVQHIAVISSETAAGYKDFEQQLLNNDYGYAIKHDLYHVAVQGRKMEHEIVDAFRQIDASEQSYDLVVLIRGGGSKLDLSGFDNYNICTAIAHCEVPVWTGIGHDVDDTIADLVAHTSYKTPTAVAAAIVDKNLSYEMSLGELFQRIRSRADMMIADNTRSLDRMKEYISNKGRAILDMEGQKVQEMLERVVRGVHHGLKQKESELIYIDKYLSSLDPEHILGKGFAYIRKASKGDVSVGDEIEIITKEQIISAQVNNIKNQ